ncbi:MAG: hypothetical protein JSU82_13845 [Rhodospirillales bacterium]|nr:MAG: hypothetical protein JSU82_13845 [Rhodospirillales bacterium]
MRRDNGSGPGLNVYERIMVNLGIIKQKMHLRRAMKHVTDRTGRQSLQDHFERVQRKGKHIRRLKTENRPDDPAVMKLVAGIQAAVDALEAEVVLLEHATDKPEQVKEVIAKGNAVIERVDGLIDFIA